MKHNAVMAAGLAVVIVAAGAGWVAGRQIESPSEAAARTAAPSASLILVPVEQRALSSEVVVRGNVRFGAPQVVNLALSLLKKNATVVSSAPVKGVQLIEGNVAMALAGRPVFVLQGDKPTYRDLGPGATGPDVEQLEKALVRLGLDPGLTDGIYDERTSAAVAAWYERSGWSPFGPTEEQQQAQRTVQADAFTAQSELIKEQETLATAQAALTTAHTRARRAANAQATAGAADAAAAAKAESDRLLAVAEVSTRTAALATAIDNETVAVMRLDEARLGVPVVPTAADLAALEAAVRQATHAVSSARSDLAAAHAALNAVVFPAPSAAAVEAGIEVEGANAEVAHASNLLEIAQRKVGLYSNRATATQPGVRLGVQVPADELLFFPVLPLRIDTATAITGQPISGPVMTVTNSRLAVDTTLSLDDTRLVKTGAAVSITEPELGIRAKGVVSRVADTPGTDGAEPQRFHLEVTPTDAPPSLVGASVVLNITVGATQGEVLAVPVAALSVGADGSSRVQVQLSDKTTRFVSITPGLAAGGLVAVTPINGDLKAGDLVVVGADLATAFSASQTTTADSVTTTRRGN